jgi:hypothetical protein
MRLGHQGREKLAFLHEIGWVKPYRTPKRRDVIKWRLVNNCQLPDPEYWAETIFAPDTKTKQQDTAPNRPTQAEPDLHLIEKEMIASGHVRHENEEKEDPWASPPF